MKLQLLVLAACLVADVSAIVVSFFCFYRTYDDVVLRRRNFPAHRVQGLIDNIVRLSGVRFEAFRYGGGVLVWNRELARNRVTAHRMLAEMETLVAEFAAS